MLAARVCTSNLLLKFANSEVMPILIIPTLLEVVMPENGLGLKLEE
jgi:hypothetical protein